MCDFLCPVWWSIQGFRNFLLHNKMSSGDISDFVCNFGWYEPFWILPIFQKNFDRSYIFMHWRCLLSLERNGQELWNWLVDVCDCSNWICSCVWLEAIKPLCWRNVCSFGVYRVLLLEHQRQWIHVLSYCTLHHPYMYNGMESCSTRSVLWRFVDLE